MPAKAGVTVTVEHDAFGLGYAFKTVPLPADNDAATRAKFWLVDGVADRNSGGLESLNDGRGPDGEDQPSKNFFFQAGTDGGRIGVDLGRKVSVGRICTYSWHSGSRAPQVFAIYASDGVSAAFLADPKRGADPAACGWQLVARVDTRSGSDEEGGQHGVMVASGSGVVGSFRFLLFDVFRTESRDPFGNTFYSEIDVIDAAGPPPTSGVVAVQPIRSCFKCADGAMRFCIDSTEAPDLTEWCEAKLKPVVQAWYPKLVAELSSGGYQAPASVTLRFRTDMGGTPASASGAGVNLNAVWFRRERSREALGAVVHELVHVVQNYGCARRTNPSATPTPGWVVEGIADYVRWFLYEPQSGGAEITSGNLARMRYDASYRVTANFLNWVVLTYDRELIRKLNAAAREGRYSEACWNEWTGQRVQDLGEAWKHYHEQRLRDRPKS